MFLKEYFNRRPMGFVLSMAAKIIRYCSNDRVPVAFAICFFKEKETTDVKDKQHSVNEK